MNFESLNYINDFNKYIFSSEELSGVFLKKPYRWLISIHDSNNNPIGEILTNDWHESPLRYKSKAFINNWKIFSFNGMEGIANETPIIFDYPYVGETWDIENYIIWAISNIDQLNIYNPIYVGKFESNLLIAEGQSLVINKRNFKIILQNRLQVNNFENLENYLNI